MKKFIIIPLMFLSLMAFSQEPSAPATEDLSISQKIELFVKHGSYIKLESKWNTTTYWFKTSLNSIYIDHYMDSYQIIKLNIIGNEPEQEFCNATGKDSENNKSLYGISVNLDKDNNLILIQKK